MRIRAVLWDLDGTLLDTLDDLAASTNAALAANGLPQRTREEVCAFVGNGVARLIALAADGADQATVEAVHAAFLTHYAAHSMDRTRPYDGVPALLDSLSAQGIAQGVISNKVDSAVRALCEAYFPGVMQVSVGDDPCRRRKPAPDSVLEAMRRLGVTPEETVYIGDSDVDVRTAANAGVACCAVAWGFRDEACLRGAGAQHIAHTPQELAGMLEGL